MEIGAADAREGIAGHERTSGSPKADRKVSRMEAAGVEFEKARFSKLLMARDFWC